ncbi:MAG: hypothetical protein R2729_07885 [Bryobacteraceae bacterium]
MRVAILTVVLAAFAWAADVAGKWTFHMETEGGPRVAPVVLTVEGETVGGTWGRGPVKGTIREGKLEFRSTVTSDEAGATAELRVEGKVEGAEIKGTWTWAEHSGTFRAVRPE